MGNGTPEQPRVLKTPAHNPGSWLAWFTVGRVKAADPLALIVQVGKTELRYRLRCLDDLRRIPKAHRDLMPLGAAGEQKPVAPDTVEARAGSPDNPVKAWYGQKTGLRGRFANYNYIPPVVEAVGLAEVEHTAKINRA